MAKRFESKRKIILRKIEFEVLYVILQVKIFLMGSFLVRRKGLKSIIPLFFGPLLFLSPNILLAQVPQWPWTFIGERIQITDNSRDNFTPSIASNGQFYFVVWAQKTPLGFDVYGVRIDKNGNRMPRFDQEENSLDAEIPISTAPNDQLYPSVIWSGENFFVVWQDQRAGKRSDIYGARVTPDGFVPESDKDGVCISEGKSTYDQINPVFSFDGENYLVVWQGKRNAKTWNIYFRMVPKDLAGLEDKEITLLNRSSKDQASPAVAFDDNGSYLILWQEKRNGRWDISGARITKTEILNLGKITSTEQFDRWSPVLSWGGDHFLALWTITVGTNEFYLAGKRISSQGKPLEPHDLVFDGDKMSRAFPALLWDGSEFLLVWEEDPAGEPKIYGAFIYVNCCIGPGPSVSDSVPIYSDGNKANPSFPAIGKVGDEVLVVWQEKNPDNRSNIFGQIISKPMPSTADGGNSISAQ